MEHKWYIIRTHSGKEFAAKKALDKKILDDNFEEIKEVVVPIYKEIVYKDGKKREVERKSFPGYIYIHMILEKQAIAFVKNSPYISAFIHQGDSVPRALSDAEARGMFSKEADETSDLISSVQIDFDVGQKVLIIDGPFNNFSGTIKEIYPEKRKVCVNIAIFGRTTPVEIDYFKVKKN